jgi:glycosyltransferase involved in cell wall biosynthesis
LDIYLANDYKCIKGKDVESNKFGGTERAFLLLKKYLESVGHTVNQTVYCDRVYDIAIHSNTRNPYVNAKKHVCRAGSYHTDAASEGYDLVIVISEFFADSLDCDNKVVIPVCYDKSLTDYKTEEYTKRRIITTSNPNRYLDHMLEIIDVLDEQEVEFCWEICGGNKLYCEAFEELYDLQGNPKFNYLGILSHEELLKELATAHLFCYPNFTDNSETFCVSIVEASALGVPVILPNRQPFLEVLPDNPYFCNNTSEMVTLIKTMLCYDRKNLFVCNTDKYIEDIVLPKIVEEVNSLNKKEE